MQEWNKHLSTYSYTATLPLMYCWATLNLNSELNLNPLQILEIFISDLQVPFFVEIIILKCWKFAQIYKKNNILDLLWNIFSIIYLLMY